MVCSLSLYHFIRLHCRLGIGVVSAPLWNSEKSKFAGMLTVLDIIHLIQYYYRTASYDYAAADVETFRLESLRGDLVNQLPQFSQSHHPQSQRSKMNWV